jgi:hypothetical protein
MRTWAAGLCIAGTVVLILLNTVSTWAENTVLSTPGFLAAMRSLPTDPAVAAQIVDEVQRQLTAALDRSPAGIGTRLLGGGQIRHLVADAVPSILDNAAFQRAWQAALSDSHAELVRVLRNRSALLTVTPGGLDVNVRVAVAQLVDHGLPRQLAPILPAGLGVSVTLVHNRALRRAAQSVRLADLLSGVLLPAVIVLGSLGLLLARHRCRALLAGLATLAVAAGAARLVIGWGQSYGSRPVVTDVAAHRLVAPLAANLVMTAGSCVLAAVGLIAIRWIAGRLARL